MQPEPLPADTAAVQGHIHQTISPPGWTVAHGCPWTGAVRGMQPYCGKPVVFSNSCHEHLSMCAIIPLNGDPLPDPKAVAAYVNPRYSPLLLLEAYLENVRGPWAVIGGYLNGIDLLLLKLLLTPEWMHVIDIDGLQLSDLKDLYV